MHSVVVFGDVRTHYVRINPDKADWESPGRGKELPPSEMISERIWGGSYMMAAAIKSALRDCQGVGVFTFDNPKEADQRYGQTWNWVLRHFAYRGSPVPRPRLHGQGPGTAPYSFPVISSELLDVLKERNGRFEDEVTDDGFRIHLPECPDIIVLDDLNADLRRTALSVGTYDECRERLNALDPIDPAKLRQAFSDVLALLVERAHRARQEGSAKHMPVMEPVILASLKVAPDAALSAPDTIWTTLLTDDWLCERTIVLLDAEDLRERGLGISTGLSWERTGQDTIAQLRRTPSFRKFLQFGQLIVRFGVTGALHIVRRTHSEWSYTLYFDPSHDDVRWTEGNDGVVLGYTSVHLATFVQSLVLHCRENAGHPFIGALASTIASAIPLALRRSRQLCEHGYGCSSWNQFRQMATEGRLFPDDLFARSCTHTQIISSTSVPPLVLRHWSILGQSVHTRVARVARDIVHHGTRRVLNQPALEFDAVRMTIAQSLSIHATQLIGRLNPETASYDAASTLPGEDHWHSLHINALHDLQAHTHLFGERSEHQISMCVPPPVVGAWSWDDLNIDPERLRAMINGKAPGVTHEKAIIEAFAEEWLRPKYKAAFEKIIKTSEAPDTPGDPLSAPVVEYGSKKGRSSPITVVDRTEIEGYRAIEKLMRQHLKEVEEGRVRRPLCIAVFGPPGSGKSTAVRKINESLESKNTKLLDAFNLAQFTTAKDLEGAFEEISRNAADSNVPIAFFDEFDSQFGNNRESLGWLKFFLAPMEDGVFRGKAVKNAIFVFAGGTSTTFAEFSLENRSRADPQWIEFSRCKGPDFVSRLRGHIDIVGINPAHPDDDLYLVRRALLIRSILEDLQELPDGGVAKVEDGMLRALLHVPEYWHGGRSVRMLLELCRTGDGKISASAVPPIQQLNMLVDGKAFLDLLKPSDAHP